MWALCAGILAGGLAGYFLKIPSGALVGGMVGGLVVKSFLGTGAQPLRLLSFFSQLLVAYVIVAQADIASVKEIPRFIPVAILYSLAILGVSILFARGVSKLCGIDLMTAVYSTAPGGLSGLGLAAVEAGANAPVSLLFHVIRITVVLISIPFIAWFLGNGH